MDPDRLQFLFGADAGTSISDDDLDGESARMEVVDRFTVLPDEVPDRELQVAIRTIVANQILDDDPPQTWQTAQRLLAAGMDRDEALAQLTTVAADQASRVMEGEAFEAGAYVAALDALPLPTPIDIARLVVDTVRARPGVTVAELLDAVVNQLSAGDSEAIESMVDRVFDDMVGVLLHLLPGDETVLLSDLVDGRSFLHRLGDSEIEVGVLSAGFDLGAFGRFENLRLVDGTVIDQLSVEHGHLGWRGPDSWLAAYEPGSLLAVTVAVDAPDGGVVDPVDGVVSIDVLASEPEVTETAVAALRAGYEALIAEPGLPVDGEELAVWLLFHHRDLFDTPQPSLTTLSAAAGLEQRGGLVAHDESIWRNDVFRRRFTDVCDMVPETEWRLVAGRALEILDDPDAPIEDLRTALAECAAPEVLDALADVLFPHALDLSDQFDGPDTDSPARLFDLVNRALDAARRSRETATAEYLACVLYERSGAPEVAEQHLQRAVQAQPRLGPIVERAGWYRFDRGDARGAMKWWRELTEPPEAATTIEPFLTRSTGATKLGRNDPCWCGSGRKFKQCHQNSSDLPALPDRVGWLCRKASLWLEHAVGDVRGTVTDMAMARATGVADPDLADFADLPADELSEMFADALLDPIVFDTALHEGGLFAMFLHERSGLLPDDEQELAASWRAIERGVHEVVGVDPGVGLALRDRATDEVVEVRERTASRQMRVGETYCARVAPDGETHQMIGGIFPVYAGQERAVLELCAARDGAEICAWVASLDAP